MSKKWVALVLGIVFLVGLTMAGCGRGGDNKPAAAGGEIKPVTIKLTHISAPGSSWQKGAEKFAELVAKKSNNKVKVDIYPSGSLSGGNTRTMLEQLQSGAVDMTVHSTIIYTGFDNKMSVFSLPFLFPDRPIGHKTVDGPLGDEMLAGLNKIGIQGLAYWESGFRELTNNKRPVTTPADVAGLKIRIPEIKLFISAFRALKADPTVMTFGEVFTALQQGTIDGQENPATIIHSSKLFEVQKYLTMWDYVWDPLILGINKKFYDGLSPDVQKILKEAAKESAVYQRQVVVDEEKALFADMEKKGMKITYLTKEQKAEFGKLMAPVYDEYRTILGKDFIDKWVKATQGK